MKLDPEEALRFRTAKQVELGFDNAITLLRMPLVDQSRILKEYPEDYRGSVCKVVQRFLSLGVYARVAAALTLASLEGSVESLDDVQVVIDGAVERRVPFTNNGLDSSSLIAEIERNSEDYKEIIAQIIRSWLELNPRFRIQLAQTLQGKASRDLEKFEEHLLNIATNHFASKSKPSKLE